MKAPFYKGESLRAGLGPAPTNGTVPSQRSAQCAAPTKEEERSPARRRRNFPTKRETTARRVVAPYKNMSNESGEKRGKRAAYRHPHRLRRGAQRASAGRWRGNRGASGRPPPTGARIASTLSHHRNPPWAVGSENGGAGVKPQHVKFSTFPGPLWARNKS